MWRCEVMNSCKLLNLNLWSDQTWVFLNHSCSLRIYALKYISIFKTKKMFIFKIDFVCHKNGHLFWLWAIYYISVHGMCECIHSISRMKETSLTACTTELCKTKTHSVPPLRNPIRGLWSQNTRNQTALITTNRSNSST